MKTTRLHELVFKPSTDYVSVKTSGRVEFYMYMVHGSFEYCFSFDANGNNVNFKQNKRNIEFCLTRHA